jgi:SAM-dependent methyltransferase
MAGQPEPDAEQRRLRGSAFGVVADAYERARPGYPEAAIDWLLEPVAAAGRPPRVLDLGAGTGKLTRQLAARGLDVVAVEPLDEMRARLAAVIPEARALAGSAERIPLPDRSVDAVLAAQAFHWFDPDSAPREMARVLRPDGALGLLWNFRDDRVPWIAALSDIIGEEDHASRRPSDPYDPGPLFTAAEERDVPNSQELDLDGLLALVSSRSYVVTMPDAERRRVLDAVADLARTHPDLAGRDRFTMAYLTRCYRCTLRS